MKINSKEDYDKLLEKHGIYAVNVADQDFYLEHGLPDELEIIDVDLDDDEQ